MVAWRERIHSHRHGLLLVALAIMGFAQPHSRGVVAGLLVYDTLLTFVLMSVLLVVFRQPRDRVWATMAAAPAILSRWGGYFVPAKNQTVLLFSHQAFVAVFLGFAVAMILRGIFSDRRIVPDHVLGSVCGYVLAGIAWGSCYFGWELISPGAFRSTVASWQQQDPHAQSFLFINFSMTVLTGAPGSDVVPARPATQTLVWMEALFGQFYLATVVAQLVSQMMLRRADAFVQDA